MIMGLNLAYDLVLNVKGLEFSTKVILWGAVHSKVGGRNKSKFAKLLCIKFVIFHNLEAGGSGIRHFLEFFIP